jgi:hypothetical protein
MMTAESEGRALLAPARAPERHPRRESAIRRVPGATRGFRAGATLLLEWAPGALHATAVGAQETTSALQALPDSTLRWLAASSVGLGGGLYLAGAPRVIVAAGVAPALAIAAAVALRPLGPGAAPGAAPRNKDGAT